MRATALIGTVALGLALGAIVLGHLLLVPMLEADTSLVDANLARAMAEPLAMRSAEVALGACVVLALVARHWLRHWAGATLALLAAGIAGANRFGVLPQVHEAWGRVDLVAMRPRVRIDAAEQLSLIHDSSLAVIVVLLIAIAALASLEPAKAKAKAKR